MTDYLSMNITINEQYPPNSFCIIEHNTRIGFKLTTNQQDP